VIFDHKPILSYLHALFRETLDEILVSSTEGGGPPGNEYCMQITRIYNNEDLRLQWLTVHQ
jgi:hypothetical protein